MCLKWTICNLFYVMILIFQGGTNSVPSITPRTTSTSVPHTTPAPIETDPQLIECPGTNANETVCISNEYGCEWIGSDSEKPSCIVNNSSPNYEITQAKTEKPSKVGFTVKISRKTDSIETASPVVYSSPSDYKKVIFDVTWVNENIVRIQFKEEGKEPKPVPLPDEFKGINGGIFNNKVYRVDVNGDAGQNFSFQVVREENNEILYDSNIGNLILSEDFHQITGQLPSNNIYGVGEHSHESFRHDFNYRKWPLFSRDQPPMRDANAQNLYGVHPYYTCLEPSGKSHGVLFLNANPMEFLFSPRQSVTFRSTGGNMDMFFILGDNPEHVVKLYSGLIGYPMIPPLWALGFQLSRYGYNNLENMKSIIEKHRNANLPLDVVHADIDHMHENKDFTFDQEQFKDFDKFVIKEQENGLHFITILDPAILALENQNYEPYETGSKEDVFIKWAESVTNIDYPENVNKANGYIYGWVWPNGPVAFPDFLKANASEWWQDQVVKYWDTVNYNGIWLDMNEPANFGTDSKENPFYCLGKPDCWWLKCPQNELENPRILPSNIGNGLSDKTLCMSAVQGDNGEHKFMDVHSLYGLWQSKATYNAVKASKAVGFPMIIGRSTYPSSGRYLGHWLGDNASKWEHMKRSIIGMLEFSLFIIPYTGADVCGFFEDTEPQLCGRWMQLGAFYPFYRNHNTLGAKNQDPVTIFKDHPTYYRWAERALETRYVLIPYLQSLLFMAGMEEFGGTVVRPLFHEFPLDQITYGIDRQFLWGAALLISPVLEENADFVDYYLPATEWYDFYTNTKVTSTGRSYNATGQQEADNRTPLHVRAGHILPTASPGALNTKQLVSSPYHIRIYPKDGKASGIWFHSDTKLKDQILKESVYRINMDFNLKKVDEIITLKCPWHGISGTKVVRPKVGSILVYDTPMPTSDVTFSYKSTGDIKKVTSTPKPIEAGNPSLGFEIPMHEKVTELCNALYDHEEPYIIKWEQ